MSDEVVEYRQWVSSYVIRGPSCQGYLSCCSKVILLPQPSSLPQLLNKVCRKFTVNSSDDMCLIPWFLVQSGDECDMSNGQPDVKLTPHNLQSQRSLIETEGEPCHLVPVSQQDWELVIYCLDFMVMFWIWFLKSGNALPLLLFSKDRLRVDLGLYYVQPVLIVLQACMMTRIWCKIR